jgi:hypothetical protein
MSDPQEIIRELRRQLTIAQESLHHKNLALDALHYVWCSGGCEGGAHRYGKMRDVPLTEELVLRAEHYVRRLRARFENVESRKRQTTRVDIEPVYSWTDKESGWTVGVTTDGSVLYRWFTGEWVSWGSGHGTTAKVVHELLRIIGLAEGLASGAASPHKAGR